MLFQGRAYPITGTAEKDKTEKKVFLRNKLQCVGGQGYIKLGKGETPKEQISQEVLLGVVLFLAL